MNRRGFLGALLASPIAVRLGLSKPTAPAEAPLPVLPEITPDIVTSGFAQCTFTTDKLVAPGDFVYWNDQIVGVALADARAGDEVQVQTYGYCVVNTSVGGEA